MCGAIQMLGDLIYSFANNLSILINDNGGKRQAACLDIANSQINDVFATVCEKLFRNMVAHWWSHRFTM